MAIDDLARASDDLERIEVQVMLEAIYQHYGFDFRGYAPGSLKRRLWRRAYAEKAETMSALEERLDPQRFLRIHRGTIVNLDRVREMQPWFSGAGQAVSSIPLNVPGSASTECSSTRTSSMWKHS